ncbi:hypothetical protein [Pseudoxanthomonas dokdonensis]|uniref:Plasmid stabilization protein ParE n=1 Tax=Pseudoxanthomonas dokdonensis TaxID=344882 RepID=A0A0R0CL91_9GAMM|nr:hypothetical protein [Pseudoxanthomonas dokdonensis]KRG70421.1 hypothetical protein ABB29_06625 [Pseudoxanthomonas dokdonensis]
MSQHPVVPEARPEPRIERLQRWFAALCSALLHLLMLLILLHSSPPIVSSPQSAAGGSRTQVRFIGQPGQTRQPAPEPIKKPKPLANKKPAKPARAASRLQSTLVDRADQPIPPVQQQATPQPQPTAPSAEPAPSPAQQPSDPPPPSQSRRPELWTGQPPGMLPRETAPENAGLSASPAVRNGRGRDISASGPSMELGGYLVYYEVLSDDKLRAWADAGIKELSIPLPGTRYYMVCDIQIAIKRGSGKCRSVDPGSPEMDAIGDARKVVTMQRVYKQGELVWSGPGPYR